MTASPVDLEVLQRLLDEATPRPWSTGCLGTVDGLHWALEAPFPGPDHFVGDCDRKPDASLIVELVNNATALIDELRRLRAAEAMKGEEIRRLRGIIDDDHDLALVQRADGSKWFECGCRTFEHPWTVAYGKASRLHQEHVEGIFARAGLGDLLGDLARTYGGDDL